MVMMEDYQNTWKQTKTTLICDPINHIISKHIDGHYNINTSIEIVYC